jgi:hypothetical protein
MVGANNPICFSGNPALSGRAVQELPFTTAWEKRLRERSGGLGGMCYTARNDYLSTLIRTPASLPCTAQGVSL